MRVSILRPGLTVQVRTSITGNVKYRTQTLKSDYTTEEGERKARWETERTVRDPAEHDAAVKARSAIRSRIQGVCIQSNAFGLSCLESKSAELDAAIAEADAVATEFNQSAIYTKIITYINVYRVEQDDARALAQINKNIRELMDTMSVGLAELDAEKVRAAANSARELGGMLTNSAKEQVQAAINLARKAARQIVEAGKTGAVEIDNATIARIQEARTSFLDLDEGEGLDVGEVVPEGRGVDLEPESMEERINEKMKELGEELSDQPRLLDL